MDFSNIPTWTCQNTTIRDIYNGVKEGLYDLNPEHQRNVVHNLDWKKNLIKTIFTTGLIPPTQWHPVISETKGKYFESVDGKQRISTICEYRDNEFGFSIDEKKDGIDIKYEDLQKLQQDHFNNFPLHIGICSRKLTNDEKHYSFEKLQKTKKTTLGEVLNSSPNLYIKENTNQLINEIIESMKTAETNKKFMEDKKRYRHFEIIAWTLFYYHNPENNTLDPQDIIKFWNTYNITTEIFNNYKYTLMLLINIIKKHEFKNINCKTTIIPIYFIILKLHNQIKENVSDNINTYFTTNYIKIKHCFEIKVNASHKACKEKIEKLSEVLESLEF